MLADFHTVVGTVKVCDGDGVSVHEQIVTRLEDAGATLLALPLSGWSTAVRGFWPDMRRDAFIDLPAAGPMKPPVPAGERIDRMDEAFAWLRLIPADRFVLRRIVGARALVHPITARHLFPWRRIGRMVGADHRAVQVWHRAGVDLIADGLALRGFIFPA